MASSHPSTNGVSFAGTNGVVSNGNGFDGSSIAVTVETARTELNETLSRLASHNGVETVQILNRDGDIITETSSNPAAAASSESTTVSSSTAVNGGVDTNANVSTSSTISNNNTGNEIEDDAGAPPSFLCKQAALTNSLMQVAASYVRNIDPDDEITFIQVRSKSGQDLMIAPHEGYVLAVHKR